MPRIVIQHSGEGDRVFELRADRPVSIGRAKFSNIVLDDSSVSRLHAVLRATGNDQWEIVDRDSANGVKINGKAVRDAALRPNDEVAIGIYRLRFEDSSARKITQYGTASLPPGIAKALGGAYAASSMPVVPLGGDVQSISGGSAALDSEKSLLMLLNRVKSELAEAKTIETITLRTLDFALEIDGAERSFLMLISEETSPGNAAKGEYAFEPANIRYRKPPRPQEHGLPQLTISRSIIRIVMQLGLPVLLTDGQADPRFASSKSIANAGIQSAMCAPLGMGARLRGLLYVDNLSERGMFTTAELNRFAVIGAQAGLAIDRVRPRAKNPEKSLA